MFFNCRNARIPAAGRLLKHVVAALALLAGAAGLAHAGSEERKGTGGALELRVPVGPRGTALGAAGSSNATGIEAAFWNPAGLADLEGTEAMFSHTAFFADQKLNFAAVATRVGGFGVLGVSAKVLSIGDVIVTTEDAPEGTGEILEPTFTVLGLSWGRQFTDRVMFGASTQLVSERILSTGATGVAFDFGLQYLTGWRGLRLGMVMKNFGPAMEFSGEDFETNLRPPDSDPTSASRTFRSTSASFELPSHFTLAATYDVFSAPLHRLAAMGAFQNNNFLGDNFCGALEWTYRKDYALRGSYFGSILTETNATTGEGTTDIVGGDDLYSGVALGAGAQILAGGTRLGVDVAWRPVREFFDDVVEVGLKFRF